MYWLLWPNAVYTSRNTSLGQAYLLWHIDCLTVEHQLDMQTMHGVPSRGPAEERILICSNGSLDYFYLFILAMPYKVCLFACTWYLSTYNNYCFKHWLV